MNTSKKGNKANFDLDLK